MVVEKVHAEPAGIASSSRVLPSTAEDLELLDHVSLACFFFVFFDFHRVRDQRSRWE